MIHFIRNAELVFSHVTVSCPNKIGRKKILHDINLQAFRGEVLGIVGESGCGKSTLARALVGLQKIESGNILFNDISLQTLDRRLRASTVQMIFQDSLTALSPRLSVLELVSEPLQVQGQLSRSQQFEKASELLGCVGLSSMLFTKKVLDLSGGQRQRVGIARALILQPDIIVCDEPVAALDVSVQAKILNLLMREQQERKHICLFISHDWDVIKYVSDKIAVMHAGVIVEYGSADDVIYRPQHEYTKKLLRDSGIR